MSKEMKRAADLIKAGDNAGARECLTNILKANPKNDAAWVYMAAVVETDELRQKCLREALKHNPRNKMAQRALERKVTPARAPMSGKPNTVQAETLPVIAHILCGWPLILAFFGGAIGGGLGGLAYGINIAIYKLSIPTVLKIVLNIIVGVAAIGIWFVIASAIAS